MSRDVDGLVQAMRALWDGYMFDLDASVVPMTFDESTLWHIFKKRQINQLFLNSVDVCSFSVMHIVNNFNKSLIIILH